jgi:hypothetical protein
MSQLTLTETARSDVVNKTITKAKELFPQIRECMVSHYTEYYGTWEYVKIIAVTLTPVVQKSFLGRSITVDRKDEKELVELSWNNKYSPPLLNLSSYDKECDEIAIWVAGQLEGIFRQAKIKISDPTKLGLPIGRRCGYCNTSNKADIPNCNHCGAPRAW